MGEMDVRNEMQGRVGEGLLARGPRVGVPVAGWVF